MIAKLASLASGLSALKGAAGGGGVAPGGTIGGNTIGGISSNPLGEKSWAEQLVPLLLAGAVVIAALAYARK